MVKIYPGELSAIDLIEVQRSPGTRTAITPFGTYPKRYLGTSVGWKGRKVPGASKMTVAEIAEALGISKDYGIIKGHGVATGVSKIASKATTVRDVYGVAVGTITGTKTRRIRTLAGPKEYTVTYTKSLMAPRRAFEIAKAHGKTIKVKTAPTVAQLIAPRVPIPYRLVPIVV